MNEPKFDLIGAVALSEIFRVMILVGCTAAITIDRAFVPFAIPGAIVFILLGMLSASLLRRIW